THTKRKGRGERKEMQSSQAAAVSKKEEKEETQLHNYHKHVTDVIQVRFLLLCVCVSVSVCESVRVYEHNVSENSVCELTGQLCSRIPVLNMMCVCVCVCVCVCFTISTLTLRMVERMGKHTLNLHLPCPLHHYPSSSLYISFSCITLPLPSCL